MVFDRYFVQFFDQFFQRFGVERVGVQGDAVELRLLPRDRVDVGEEFGCRHPPRALRGRRPEEAAEDDLGAGVDPFDHRRGDVQQARVALRRGRIGEVEEVGLVPDLPGADRQRLADRFLVLDGAGRVLGPEFTAGPVAFDRGFDEQGPGLALLGVVDRQRRPLAGDPVRGVDQEGQHLQPVTGGDQHRFVDPGPVVAAPLGGLHRRPGDRPAHRFDPPRGHVFGVLFGQRRLRPDPEEALRGARRRHRLGALRPGQEKESRAERGNDGEGDCDSLAQVWLVLRRVGRLREGTPAGGLSSGHRACGDPSSPSASART